MAEKTEKSREAPVVTGTVTDTRAEYGEYSIIVLCPYCNREHTHGYDLGYMEPSIRSSHCGNGSYRIWGKVKALNNF